MFVDKSVVDIAQQLAISTKDFWFIIVTADIMGCLITIGFFSEVFTTIQNRNKCTCSEQKQIKTE